MGGEATGANLTDRAKRGVNRHMLIEANGSLVGPVVSGANVHDIKEGKDVLLTMPFLSPFAKEEYPQHFHAEKGYDSIGIYLLIEELEYNSTSKAGDRKSSKLKSCNRARTWVCKRTY